MGERKVVRMDVEIECKGAGITPINSYEIIANLEGVDCESLIDSLLSAKGADSILDKMKIKDVLSWIEGSGYTVHKNE